MIETVISTTLSVVEAEAFKRAVAPVSEKEALRMLIGAIIYGFVDFNAVKEEAER